MYFFSIVIAFSLLILSFGSEITCSSVCKYELEGLYVQVKPLLSNCLIIHINSILIDYNSPVTFDDKWHLIDIYNKVTDVEELEKLSRFFFKFLEYLQILILEMAKCNKDFRVNQQRSLKVAIVKNCDWAHTALLVVNFALLRQRFGPSNFTSYLRFEIITQPQMQQVEFAIEFIEKILDKKLNEELDLNDRERRAFKLFLLFLKDFCKQLHEWFVVILNPPRREFIGSSFIKSPHVIDGIIESYQLDD